MAKEDKHVYSFGNEGEPTLRTRVVEFLVRNGLLTEVVLKAIESESTRIRFRQFVYGDDELRSSFHSWLEKELQWPIQPGEDDFWNMKFAKWFTGEQQQEHLRTWFKDKVAPSLEKDDD